MARHPAAARRRPAPSPGPTHLWILRHGQSAGNVARDAAELAHAERFTLATRDVDVPLTEFGRQQAHAVATWLRHEAAPPTVIFTSPYRRALETAGILAEGLQAHLLGDPIRDERLRERELGILDHLTRPGIERHHPQEAERMTILGKFYHRPPGGENWCDVILRMRSWFDTMCREFPDERILVVTHSVGVMCLVYLVERLDEGALMDLAQQAAIANCGLTGYRRGAQTALPAALARICFNHVAPLASAGAPVTSHPDHPAGPAP